MGSIALSELISIARACSVFILYDLHIYTARFGKGRWIIICPHSVKDSEIVHKWAKGLSSIRVYLPKQLMTLYIFYKFHIAFNDTPPQNIYAVLQPRLHLDRLLNRGVTMWQNQLWYHTPFGIKFCQNEKHYSTHWKQVSHLDSFSS